MGLPYDLDKQNNGDSQTAGPKFIIDTLSESPHNSANEFNFQLQSGKLKFVNIQAKLSGSFPVDKFLVPNTWKTRFQIDNSKKLTIQRPIFITRLEDDVVFIPEEIKNLEYEIEFEHITTTPATSSAFLTSYADVTFGNLRTFSGDVNKVKLFGRQKDKQNAEFEKFGEFILETKNELKDSTSITGDDPVGIFYSQSVVDNFWQSSSAAQPIEIDNTQIMNAVLVSGSNYADGNFVEFKTKNQFELEKNEEYIVSFQSYYIKKNKQQADGSVRKSAEIEVFLSGSVISQTGGTLSLGSVSDFGDNASELLKGNVSGSIPRLYNYFTTHKKSGIKPKAGLIFRVNAGEFYISNVKLEPVSDRNFNPGFYKTIVPMPIGSRRGQRYDFVSEFYDSNNNKADFEAVTSASVAFAGAPQVLADGTDAVLSGSVQIGNSMQMYGVNPAFLRSIGYDGFNKTIAGTGDRNGGFMLWSGSIGSTIGASETYNGVGLEVVDASSTNKHEHAFLQFASNYKGTGNPRFRVQTNEFLLGVSGSGAAETFISGSQGKLRISSSNFHLDDDGAVTMQGTITAAAGGTIGGFTIGTNDLTATNFALNTSLQSIVLGSGNNILIASASLGLSLGHATFTSAPFKVTPTGQITGSQVLFTGGKIGGFTIDADEIKAGSTLILDADTNSGQIKLGGATSIIAGSDGIYMDGTGDFRVGDADGERISFDASAESLVISSSTFMIGSKANGKSFISASDAYGLEISSSNFHLSASGKITASAVKLSGDITAQTGNIGGFTIDTDEIKSGTTLILDSDTNSGQIKLGGATSITAGNDGVYMDGTGDFRVGDADGNRISFDQSTGILILSSSDFFLGSKANGKSFISSSAGGELEISSSFFHLSSSGHITGSKVLFDGGVIGGWTISSNTLTGGNTTLNSNGTITLGASANSNVDGTNRGIYMDAGGDFLVFGDSSNFIRFDVSDNDLDIKTAKFKLDTDRLDIDSDNSRISVFDDTASPKEVVRIGQVDGAVDSSNTNYGMKIFDGTGTDDTDILVEFSETENNIAGWDISTSTISKNNLVLNSAGQISSQGYASNQQGFFLGMRPLSDGSVGAFLEVDEANIRGTLKTTVFEKESVNAVGGQLHIANSTTITGSVSMSTTDTTMQVANASGFSSGEIIQLKKFNPTGFTTEYMKIHSVSLKDAGSETNFSGSLVVTRSLGTSAPTNTVSSSIGFSGSAGQEYTPGQVIVSTGKIGTGYIRLNANPNDQTTPYMDIVERTGSGVYDINLKARLGDLSGVVDTINGQSVSGFGLYTDNAFLKGGIVATYGSIGGFNMSSTDLWAGNATLGNAGTKIVIGDSSGTPKIALGGQADNITLTSGDGVFIDGDGNFRVGDVNGNRIIFDGTNFAITSSNFGLETSTMHISSSNGGVIAMGSTIPKGNDFTDNGIMLSGSGEFNFQLDSDNFIRRDGNELNLKSEVFGLKTSKMVISSSLNNGTIALGSTPPTSINYTANSGIYMDGNGDFLVRGDNDNFIKFDVSDKLSIAAEDFELDAGGLKLIGNSGTAANNQIRLGSATALNTGDGLFASGDGKFRVGADNGHRLEFDGTNLVVSSSDFFLGSKGSNNAYISSSGNVLEISSSKFSLNSDGTVEVEGSISITSGDLAGVTKAKISGSSDALSGSLATRQTNTEATSSTLKTDSGSLAARLKLDSNGVDVLNSSDVSIAQLTNSLRIGRDAAGQSRLEIDSSGNLSIINRQGSTDTNVIQLLANGNSSFSGSGTFGGAITATSGKIAGWDINSNRLDSTNDKVILDGNNNNGEIRLGSSPPTSATNGAGIYLGGDGTFLVGDADGHRVSFENSKLIVSSSTFFLGSKGSANSYISSSGDVLEISSSKFALKKNGDVSIEGTVTATAGDIGGWNINSNDLVGGSVRLFQEGIIQLTGNTQFAGASKDALGEISGSGTIGPSFELKRKSYNANYVDVVKINTSGSYDNTDTYVNNEDKQTVSITRSGTTSEQSAVATFGATQTSWDESYYIKAKDSSNQTVAELDTSAPGTNELIDLGAANQVFELVFQNLQEAAKPQVGSPPGGSAKSLYRYRVELYQNDSNTTSGAELVGSFNISSVLTINSSFSFADLNTSSTTFFPFRRYIYVKVVGTRYDELTGDNGSGTEHSLNMSGAPFSITSYVPKTRVNAVGLQSYAGPNQEVRIGAVNEVKGDFTVNGISGGGRGNLIVSGSGTFGTLGTFSPDFQLYVEGDMAATGNITAFFSSDKRLKENIIEIGEGLSIVNQLRPVRFDWKEDIPFHTENISEYGLIAQEVEDVLPEVVGLMKGDYKGIKYDKIVPLLISSIKELTKRVEELEKDNQ